MLVTPKFVNLPKAGKKYANIKLADDSVFWYKPEAFSFEAGRPYDITTKQETWGDKPATVITGMVPQVKAPTTTTGNGGDHAGLSGDELRFISNIVGSAIESGKLDDPSQVSLWAKAALATLKELA